MTPEGAIQKVILAYLKAKHYDAWRQNQGGIPTGKGGFRSFNGRRGLPDIMGFMPLGKLTHPQMFFIEVKVPGKKPSADQMEFLESATKHGHLAFVAYSLKDVMDRGL